MTVTKQAKEANQAAIKLATISTKEKNKALSKIASALRKNKNKIIQANKKDLDKARKNRLNYSLLKIIKDVHYFSDISCQTMIFIRIIFGII